MDRVQSVIIGAGIVGLAVARHLARLGQEVVILEAADTFGSGISSRNSEVLHAGMYYPPASKRARLCVQGHALLRRFLVEYGVAHRITGKLIVACDPAEHDKLHQIQNRAAANGVIGLHPISAAQVKEMEPHLSCHSALFSSETGIIDSHGLMLALLGDAQTHGAVIAYRSPVLGGECTENGIILTVGGTQACQIMARNVVIAAGLQSCSVARSLRPLSKPSPMVGLANVPQDYLCKGNYFALHGPVPFRHLVYPVPVAGGLGTHFTLDLAGQGRFGPDVEWIETEEYSVRPERSQQFYQAIRRYWPDLPDNALQPAYAGIRPKIHNQHQDAADFQIHGRQHHGQSGLVALYGIESPGLTSCLAIAQEVAKSLLS